MSGTLTPYGRGLLLQAVFQPDLYSGPAHLYLAYTRETPVSNADASQLDEPTSGYARADAGVVDSSSWGFTGFTEVYNINRINFAAAGANWGLMQGWALLDSPTLGVGNVVAVGTIVEPFQVETGDAPYIDVAGLGIGIYD